MSSQALTTSKEMPDRGYQQDYCEFLAKWFMTSPNDGHTSPLLCFGPTLPRNAFQLRSCLSPLFMELRR